MRVSALTPLAEAIIAAVKGDAVLMALLTAPGIHQGDVPPSASTAAAYLTLSAPTETAENRFQRAGTANGEQVHIWGATPHEVRRIAGEVMRVLGNEPFFVEGFDLIGRSLDFLDVRRDPDVPKYHGVIRFAPRLTAWQSARLRHHWRAADQAAGQQTLTMIAGDAGVLGDTVAVEASDAVLDAGPPAQLVTGSLARRLTFGDRANAYGSPFGFTEAIAVEVGANVAAGANTPLGAVHTFAPDAGIVDSDMGWSLYTFNGSIWGDVYYGQSLFHWEDAHNDAGLVAGRYVLAMDYSPRRPWKERIRLFLNGERLETAHNFLGDDGTLDVAGLPTELGDEPTFGIVAPAGYHEELVFEGILSENGHLALADSIISAGWQ